MSTKKTQQLIAEALEHGAHFRLTPKREDDKPARWGDRIDSYRLERYDPQTGQVADVDVGSYGGLAIIEAYLAGFIAGKKEKTAC